MSHKDVSAFKVFLEFYFLKKDSKMFSVNNFEHGRLLYYIGNAENNTANIGA